LGVLRVSHFNGIIESGVHLSSVAMVTRILRNFGISYKGVNIILVSFSVYRTCLFCVLRVLAVFGLNATLLFLLIIIIVIIIIIIIITSG